LGHEFGYQEFKVAKYAWFAIVLV